MFGSYAVLFSAFLPLTGIHVGFSAFIIHNQFYWIPLRFWTYWRRIPITNTSFCYSFRPHRTLSSLTGSDGNTIGIHRYAITIARNDEYQPLHIEYKWSEIIYNSYTGNKLINKLIKVKECPDHLFLDRRAGRGWPTFLIASQRSLVTAVSVTEAGPLRDVGLGDRRLGIETADRTGLGWRIIEEAYSERDILLSGFASSSTNEA